MSSDNSRPLLTTADASALDQQSADETIVVLSTGGTIDKHYYDELSLYQVTETVVARLLEIARVMAPYRIVEVLRKDSLEMDDADRARLVEAARGAPSRRIVVTHGTDTMTLSAEALAGVEDKTIVLVGALTPARFSESDAAFNLGMAFAAAQIAAPGVYITMNGAVFHARDVVKDRALNAFVRRERGS